MKITLIIINICINLSLVACPTLYAMEAETPPVYTEEDAKLKHAQDFAITGELLPAVVSFDHSMGGGRYIVEGSSYDERVNIETSKNPCDKFLCLTSTWVKKIHFEALRKHEPVNPKIMAGLKLTPRALLNVTNKDGYFSGPQKALALLGGEVRRQEVVVFTLTDGSTQYMLNDDDRRALQQLTQEQRRFIQSLTLRDSATESILNDAEWKMLNALPEEMSKLLKSNLNLRLQGEVEHKTKSEIAMLEEVRLKLLADIAKETEKLEKKHEALYREYQAKLEANSMKHESLYTNYLKKLDQASQHFKTLYGDSESLRNSMQEARQAIEQARDVLHRNLERAQKEHTTHLETDPKQTNTNRNILFAMMSLGVLAGTIWLIKYLNS